MTCIKAIISGRVQGVFFRDSTRQRARSLNIRGHAINLANGNVEVIACGDQDAIHKLVEWLHQGPEYAQVTAVDVEPISLQPPTGFTIG